MHANQQIRSSGFIILGIFFILLGPIIVSLIYHEKNTIQWLHCGIIAIIVALFLVKIIHKHNFMLYHRDAILIVVASWAAMIAIGSIPYLLIIPNCSFPNALFESISGYTSTGASIFNNVEQLPNSLLFYRAITQWIGGLGIVTLFALFLPLIGTNPKKLYSNETSLLENELADCSIKQVSYNIFITYITLTLFCIAAFYTFGMNLFDAICHTFTTVSTGGFTNYNDSFMNFQSCGVKFTAILFMIIGGTNFQIIVSIFTLRFSILKKNDEFKIYLLMIFIITILLIIGNILHEANTPIIDNIFQVISIMTTTGISTNNCTTILPTFQIIFITIMLIGGCTGSTSGGIKIARSAIIIKAIRQQIKRTFRPHLIHTIKINNNSLEQEIVSNQITLLCLHIILIIGSIFFITLIQSQLNLANIFSIVATSISNTGIIVGNTQSIDFSNLHTLTKLILSLLMLLGRLEIYPILCLCTPSFWKIGTKKSSKHSAQSQNY